MPKKWQEDENFLRWLQKMGYIRMEKSKIRLVMSGGLYLYMYEAWRGRGDED
jgi:hypothetical protein